MKNLKIIMSSLVLFIVLFACNKENTEIDTEKPTINMDNGFPTNCVVIKKGKPFIFKALFKDNKGLAGYSIDIHHNFDHHTHSTDMVECDLLPKKKPVNAFKKVKTYKIEGNPTSYQASQEFMIDNEYDSGNYHFSIKVVDKEGWTSIKGISFTLE